MVKKKSCFPAFPDEVKQERNNLQCCYIYMNANSVRIQTNIYCQALTRFVSFQHIISRKNKCEFKKYQNKKKIRSSFKSLNAKQKKTTIYAKTNTKFCCIKLCFVCDLFKIHSFFKLFIKFAR